MKKQKEASNQNPNIHSVGFHPKTHKSGSRLVIAGGDGSRNGGHYI